jgi:hypothetical protein
MKILFFKNKALVRVMKMEVIKKMVAHSLILEIHKMMLGNKKIPSWNLSATPSRNYISLAELSPDNHKMSQEY